MKTLKVCLLFALCCTTLMLSAKKKEVVKPTVLRIESAIESPHSALVPIEIEQQVDSLNIKINSTNKQESFRVQLFKEDGGALQKLETKDSIKIDMSPYVDGIYMLNVSNDLRGLIHTYQVTKKK